LTHAIKQLENRTADLQALLIDRANKVAQSNDAAEFASRRQEQWIIILRSVIMLGVAVLIVWIMQSRLSLLLKQATERRILNHKIVINGTIWPLLFLMIYQVSPALAFALGGFALLRLVIGVLPAIKSPIEKPDTASGTLATEDQNSSPNKQVSVLPKERSHG